MRAILLITRFYRIPRRVAQDQTPHSKSDPVVVVVVVVILLKPRSHWWDSTSDSNFTRVDALIA